MSDKILVLNRFYFPVGTCDVRKTFGNIFSEVVHPLDIVYDEDGDGNKLDTISYFNVIKTAKDWMDLPIREYDNRIKTIRGDVRIPSVVVCATYEGIPHKKVLFPTKHNIFKRDKNICGYSGLLLNGDTLTVDHIYPRSRCTSNPNTWENQVACHKELNRWKGDKLIDECDLTTFNPQDPKLRIWMSTQGKRLKLMKPVEKPRNGYVFVDFLEDWEMFLKSE
jgi:5-methylcytosine-specific restriction endonuclease McrA